MSAYLYDKSLLQKLNKITENTNVHVYGPDDSKKLFQIIADTSDDKPVTLPIVSLRRAGGYLILERGNNARSINSLLLTSNKNDTDAGEYSIRLNQIPISIPYDIDVYARYFEEADAIMRELIFILTNSPNVDIVIPYDGIDYVHRSALSLGDLVLDNSSIPERLINGQFTRLTISCEIPDAHLFDTRIATNTIMSGQLLIQSSEDDVVEERLDFGEEKIN